MSPLWGNIVIVLCHVFLVLLAAMRLCRARNILSL
jgi:hypothetical protein